MEETLIKLVAIYGPLALGWLAWFMERQENKKNQERLLDLFAASTATMAALKQLLDERLPRARK